MSDSPATFDPRHDGSIIFAPASTYKSLPQNFDPVNFNTMPSAVNMRGPIQQWHPRQKEQLSRLIVYHQLYVEERLREEADGLIGGGTVLTKNDHSTRKSECLSGPLCTIVRQYMHLDYSSLFCF